MANCPATSSQEVRPQCEPILENSTVTCSPELQQHLDYSRMVRYSFPNASLIFFVNSSRAWFGARLHPTSKTRDVLLLRCFLIWGE